MRLFDRFSSDLVALHPKAAGRYGCPICLGLFDRSEADQLLTVEHIIPNRLGERLVVLTCKTCNNDVGGAKLDWHLHQQLSLESSMRGTGQPITVELKVVEHRVAAKWERTATVDGIKNNLRIIKKATSPRAELGVKDAMQKMLAGDEMDLAFRIASARRANVSVLKSGYLLAFKELGYRLIVHDNLGPIRQQIQKPTEEIVPIEALVLRVNDPSAVNCVMAITDPQGIDGILVCLKLKTQEGLVVHKGVLLPTPASPSDFFERARAMQQAGDHARLKGHLLRPA